MKTILVLDGKVIMSQDGEHLDVMQSDALQYPGAVASVVTDEEYVALTAPTPDEIKAKDNAPILAQLAAADLKIIRAIAEGDTVRIEAHKTAQAALRAQLR